MFFARNINFFSAPLPLPLAFLCFFLLFLNFNVYGKGDSEALDPHDLVIHDLKDLEIASIDKLLPEGVIRTQSLTNSPMPKLKASKLGQILTRHYDNCLGGANYWKTVKSIKISADLNTLSGIYQYESVTKKPNLFKISYSLKEKTYLIAFDGTNIRHKQISKEGVLAPDIANEFDRMVNETELPRYLLFPLQAGKAYQYLGTVREFNTVCYKIRLFTDQNFVIDYFLDVKSCLIVTIKVLDTLKKFDPILIRYFDYQLIDGIYFAQKIESFINGQWDSLLSVNSIATNVGAARWMFNLDNITLNLY
ncbi:MAG: hypothetical protein ACJZ9B_04250 [Coraliomargaritaceae bacterium]